VITPSDLARIEALARQATSGPWRVASADWFGAGVIGPDDVPVVSSGTATRNAAYIAAVSPDVALALIKRVRELEAVAVAITKHCCVAETMANGMLECEICHARDYGYEFVPGEKDPRDKPLEHRDDCLTVLAKQALAGKTP